MKIKQLTIVAILVAASVITSFFSIPIMPSASFLKLDFSDVFILLAALVTGWKGLTLAAIGKGLVLYMKSSDMIGAVASITASLMFNVVFYGVYQKTKRFLLASILAVLSLAISLSILNYTVFLPLYTTFFHVKLGSLDAVVLYAILPFNVIKGIALSIVDVLVIKRTKILKKEC